MAAPQPYRSTPVFDETTLPGALRARHDTKAGVWGVIRVISGQLRLTLLDPQADYLLSPNQPGLVEPQQPHYVTPDGPMTMQVDFYAEFPGIAFPPGV